MAFSFPLGSEIYVLKGWIPWPKPLSVSQQRNTLNNLHFPIPWLTVGIHIKIKLCFMLLCVLSVFPACSLTHSEGALFTKVSKIHTSGSYSWPSKPFNIWPFATWVNAFNHLHWSLDFFLLLISTVWVGLAWKEGREFFKQEGNSGPTGETGKEEE